MPLRPSDLDCSLRFCRDVLGLAVYREFGPADHPGMVFFPGQGLPGASGHAAGPAGGSVMIWIQVRDVRAEHARLAAARAPVTLESTSPCRYSALDDGARYPPDLHAYSGFASAG
jgi:hypothetical protein